MSTGEKCTDVPIGQAVGYFKYGSFSEYMVSVQVFNLQNNNKNCYVKRGVFPGLPASLTLV